MNIGVIGLGLIGGSLCKAFSQRTKFNIYGMDTDNTTLKKALDCGAIKEELTYDNISLMDIVIVSLHPLSTMKVIENISDKCKDGCIITDTCGIKKVIVDSAEKSLKDKKAVFIGCHPMAGREFSGFDYSISYLFENASCIFTPTEHTPVQKLKILEDTMKQAGFEKIVISTVEKHDQTIAFTSQLAHVISNTYIKSPSLYNESGFSAGSFLDLTRVARLNEDMWTQLFILNKEPLVNEIDVLINNLTECRNAIADENENKLKEILRKGRELKENL